MKICFFLFIFIINTSISQSLKTNTKLHESASVMASKSEKQNPKVQADVQKGKSDNSEDLEQKSQHKNQIELKKKDSEKVSEEKSPTQHAHHVKLKKKDISSQTKKTAENEEQEESDESYVRPSKQKKKKSSSVSPLPETQKPYSRTLLASIFIYGFVAVLILLVIKFKASESYAGRIIDRVVEAALYKIANNFFNRRKGYSVAEGEEQKDDQQIDYGDKVKMGYNETEGRDLFWQKKSVEGI